MSKHGKRLIEMVNRPNIVGVRKPIFSAREINLFRSNGDLYGEIDCLIFNGELYHIEYKNSRANEDKGRAQLTKQRGFIRRLGYKGRLHSLLICGDDIDEI